VIKIEQNTTINRKHVLPIDVEYIFYVNGSMKFVSSLESSRRHRVYS